MACLHHCDRSLQPGPSKTSSRCLQLGFDSGAASSPAAVGAPRLFGKIVGKRNLMTYDYSIVEWVSNN